MVGVICLWALTPCFDDEKRLPTTPQQVADRMHDTEPDPGWLWSTLCNHPEFVNADVGGRKLSWAAISANRPTYLEYFLDAGAELDAPIAAYTGNQSWLKRHFANGGRYTEHFQIDFFPLVSDSLLHIAARGGQVQLLEYLLTTGKVPFSELLDSGSLVRRAADAGSEEAVDVLLRFGAPGIEQAALRQAWNGKDLPMLAHLIEKVPGLPKYRYPELDFVLSRSWPAGTTLLTHAAEYDNLAAIDLLLAKGADATVKDADGRSALDYVSWPHGVSGRIAKRLRAAGAPMQPGTLIRHGELREIEALIHDGTLKVDAPVLVRGEDLMMPLRVALDSDRAEVIALLIRHGADPFLGYKNQGSVVEWFMDGSFERRKLEAVVDALDAKGLDRFRAWRHQLTGGTLLHEASENGNVAAIRLLLKAGIDKTVKNKEGKTAADLACNDAVRRELK